MAISTNANPTYAFEDDTDTGMYRSSSNALAFTTGGVQRLLISSAGVTSTTGNLRAGGGLSTSVGTDFGSQQSFWATAGGSTHQAGYTIGWNTGANNGRTQKMYLDNNGNLNVTGSITAGTAGVTTQDHRVPAGAGYITYSPGNASADVLNIRKYGTVQQKFDQYGVTFPVGLTKVEGSFHTTGVVKNNSVREYAQYIDNLVNNSSVNFDIPVSRTGTGITLYYECMYNHFGNQTYGSWRSGFFSYRSDNNNTYFDHVIINNGSSSTGGGGWTVTLIDANTSTPKIRFNKGAGTYVGSGDGHIFVRGGL